MSNGPIYKNDLDGLLSQSIGKIVDKMSCGGMQKEKGDWGSLPLEPCRFCHKIGGVLFRVDDSPLGKNQPQVVRCDLCGRDWEVTSSLA